MQGCRRIEHQHTFEIRTDWQDLEIDGAEICDRTGQGYMLRLEDAAEWKLLRIRRGDLLVAAIPYLDLGKGNCLFRDMILYGTAAAHMQGRILSIKSIPRSGAPYFYGHAIPDYSKRSTEGGLEALDMGSWKVKTAAFGASSISVGVFLHTRGMESWMGRSNCAIAIIGPETCQFSSAGALTLDYPFGSKLGISQCVGFSLQLGDELHFSLGGTDISLAPTEYFSDHDIVIVVSA
jgi:hypothetical protein